MLLIGMYYVIIYLVNFIPICWLTEGFPVMLSYEFPLALQAWLQLMEEAAVEADPSGLKYNREAQHRYLTWRAEKVISILAYVILSISYISFINSSGLDQVHVCLNTSELTTTIINS